MSGGKDDGKKEKPIMRKSFRMCAHSVLPWREKRIEAEREAEKVKKCQYMAGHIGENL